MPDEFSRFSQRAREALICAQEEALRLDQTCLETAHLLLGLLRVERSVAGRVLAGLGLELARAREAVEHSSGRGQRRAGERVELGPATKLAIESAVDYARALGHRYIGTGHLLLGLSRDSGGTAAGALAALGVTPGLLRERTLQALADSDAEALPHEGPAPGQAVTAPTAPSPVEAAALPGKSASRARLVALAAVAAALLLSCGCLAVLLRAGPLQGL